MYNETTATHVVVEKFNVKQTTIHRQLYGKKYPGGGQMLKQMKERTSKKEKQATTTRPVSRRRLAGKRRSLWKKQKSQPARVKEKAKSRK